MKTNSTTNKLIWPLGLMVCVAVAAAISINKDTPGKLVLYFDREPYVNPKVIQDMTTWLSDTGDQVIGIDLLGSRNSNRYFCQSKIRKTESGSPFVYYQDDRELFGYRYIGTTASGIDVLKTTSSGDGSGVFHNLIFVAVETDKCLSFDSERLTANLAADRLVIKKFGEIPLGDRFEGSVEIKGEYLYIRQNNSGLAKGTVDEKVILIKRSGAGSR